jgi:hypothetical protein
MKEIFGERVILNDEVLSEDFKIKIMQVLSSNNAYKFKFTTEMDDTEMEDSSAILIEDYTPINESHTSLEEFIEEGVPDVEIIVKKPVKSSVIDHYSLLDSKKEENYFRRSS